MLRVRARVLLVETDVAKPPARRPIETYARRLVETGTPAEIVEGLMELGALVCVTGRPRCAQCPIAGECRGLAAGRAADLPVKAKVKPKRLVRVAAAFAVAPDSRLLVERRPAAGLLAGHWGLPQAEAEGDTPPDLPAHLSRLGIEATPGPVLAALEHVFSHRIWRMELVECRLLREPGDHDGLRLVPMARLGALPLAIPHRKLLARSGRSI